MNSIDWNQFHTPQEAIEYCEGAIGQDPPKWAEGYQAINCFRRRLSSLTQPLGAGLMTPYHLELIRQTFDGLFRPSSPDSAGKDLLLDIGGEEDEPEREEPSSPAPAATHTAPGAPPAPTPTAPKAPTALTAQITFMDGRRLSEFELVLGYWLGWCAAQLPPAMQDYLMPEHCPYARLWEEMGHHDIPRASKRMLKTVDRELREERRALREEAASEHPEPPKSEPAKRATLKALLSQAEPTSEAEAKAAEADDEYEVKACALPPESATEEAQPSHEHFYCYWISSNCD
ncbi:hypothetical protein PAPYR_10461 [Paratrimastix pyriformis]|uniref:Uncharacterized protein n=1 Tax=Paratrimastix pyriformis TaxID=342808 RepID=A0ABQ8UD60_9EUKA|nr:hypothetical protein PAPYR_10461 [Paratrimastix pyriformis]